MNDNPIFAIADSAEELRAAGGSAGSPGPSAVTAPVRALSAIAAHDHALDEALARLTSTLRTLTPNVPAR